MKNINLNIEIQSFQFGEKKREILKEFTKTQFKYLQARKIKLPVTLFNL